MLGPVLMKNLSCKCLCRSVSCFSTRSSHSIHPPTVSGLCDGQPHPPSPSRVPDAVETPPVSGEGVNVPVEQKGKDAPTKIEETTETELFHGENGVEDMDDVDGEDEPRVQMPLKSCLKRHSGTEDGRKGRVKWLDILGKDLVQVQEFESSDTEGLDGEHDITHSCVCVIQ